MRRVIDYFGPEPDPNPFSKVADLEKHEWCTDVVRDNEKSFKSLPSLLHQDGRCVYFFPPCWTPRLSDRGNPKLRVDAGGRVERKLIVEVVQKVRNFHFGVVPTTFFSWLLDWTSFSGAQQVDTSWGSSFFLRAVWFILRNASLFWRIVPT